MEIFLYLWNLLGTHSSPIGALSSIVFGASSIIIAVLAYRLTRFNNYGLRPIILQTQRTLGNLGENESVFLGLQFEVWNRQKYPITVDFLKVKLLNEQISDANTGWFLYPTPSSAVKDVWDRLEHGAFQMYSVELFIRAYDFQHFKDIYTIEVRYFDPITNNKETIAFKDSFDAQALLAMQGRATNQGRGKG